MLNETGYMQGTFVSTMPQDLDFYSRSVLKSYHEQNLLTLQQIIGYHLGIDLAKMPI